MALRSMSGILDQLPIAVALLDTETQVQAVNPSFTLLFGSGGAAGTYPDYARSLGIFEDDESEVLQKVREGARPREHLAGYADPSSGELRFVIRKTYAPVRAPRGGVAGIAVYHIDQTPMFTANERLERALSELQAAQHQIVETEKLASLGRLVAGVAHDINTPVGNARTAVTGLLEEAAAVQTAVQSGQLRKSELDEFLSSLTEGLEICEANLRRAGELVRNFKEVAVDRTRGDRRTVELCEYIDGVIRSLHPQLRRLPYQVELNCAGPFTAYLDPGALSQIVTNLVLNAVTHGLYQRGNGTVTVSLRQDGPDGVLSVHDDGNGIDPAVRDSLYEPFVTTARDRGGSGLGLQVVHNLVHGSIRGAISVESERGKFTEFRVRIPLETEESSE